MQTSLDSCPSIAGNISNPIQVNTDILYPTENLSTEDTNIGYTISIGSLATALIVSVVIFITVIAVTLIRSKTKIKAAHDLQLTNRIESSTIMESVYEEVIGLSPSASSINTQKNVAYGHAKTSMIAV